MVSKVSGIIEKINVSGTERAIASTAYGYCETDAGTAAKTVDMTGFKLYEGVTIHVKFENSNNASSPTLNVQGTGDKPIVQYGATAVETASETIGWHAGAILTLTYDGTSWVSDALDDSGVTANTYGTNTTTTSILSYGSTFKVPFFTVDKAGRLTDAGVKSYQLPASQNTATAADDILDGSNSGTEIKYKPYTSRQNKLSLYTGTTAPNGTTRLNLNGYLYATKLYSNGTEVLTSHQSLAAYAPLASPDLTGTPTAPTAANGTSTTQIATTEFVNNTLSYVNAMTFKGTLGTNGTVTALPASHQAGDTYRVITEGEWAGKQCEVGTLIICVKDSETDENTDWTSVETNEDGAVIGPSSSTGNNIATFSGNTGRIIQDSAKAFSTATPSSSSTNAQIPTAKAVWAAINALDADYLKLDGSNNMAADVNIIAGDTDKFVNFWYNANKTAGASWRIGELGSGSSDTNYFVIQSGTSNTSKTDWNNTIRIGANTFNVYLPSTTASTSTITGALTVEGGAGIKGQLTATRLAANGSNTDYNLYVNGKTLFNIGTNDSVADKRFLIKGNNKALSLGGGGIYAYTVNNDSYSNGQLNLQYFGGNIQIGNDGTGQGVTGNVYGNFTYHNSIIFNNKKGIKHIEFMREKVADKGPSYICYPENGELAIGYAVGYDSSLAVFDGNTALRPGKSNTFNLGTSSYKWANVYATTFTGDLSGNATSATSLYHSETGGQSYASNDTHYMEIGYLDCSTPVYQNAVLLISSAFWGNQHGSIDIISIQQDRSTNSDSKPIKCGVYQLHCGGSHLRKFYYKKDDTNYRLYLYVYVTGGNSYGKWKTSIIQSNAAWHQEYAFNQSDTDLIEVEKTTVPIATDATNAITATAANLLNASTAENTSGLQYYKGQPTIGSADGNGYDGSSANYKLWSYPADYTTHSGGHANIQTIRAYWSSTYFHDIFMSPNNENLLHRSVLAGSAKNWRVILDSANYNTYAANKSHTHNESEITWNNNTLYPIGDDIYIGDVNVGGHLGLKAKNASYNTGLIFIKQTTSNDATTSTTGGKITWDGTKFSITSTTAVDASISGNAATATSASYLSGSSITTEDNIESGTRAYMGSGSGWTGSITSMKYAGILQIYGGYSRGWQIWAQRGATNSLHWRNPNDDANAWTDERIILDTGNTTIPPTVPTLSWGAEATILTINGSAVKIKAMPKPTYNWGDIGDKPIDANGKWSININGKADTAGAADTAITATNLSTEPSFAVSNTNNITLTVGNQTSSAFTIPYATAATHAAYLDAIALSNQNLNDYKNQYPTWYYAAGGNTITNKPSGVNAFGMYIYRIADGYRAQELYDSVGSKWMRFWNTGAWSSWKKVAYTDSDITGNAATATTLAASKTIWGQSFDGSANITGNLIDVGSQIKAQSGVSLLSFLTSAGGALQAKFGRLGLNSSYSNADLTNYVLDVGGVSRFTGQMNITYAPTGTDSTGKGLLNLTSSAAATVVKSGTYSWGINHLVTNLASGGNTCLMTGASNGTNNQAVLEFHYHGSNNAENAVGLGLYGNNGLLTINKAGTVKIKATTASTSTTTGALVVGGGIATGAASYLTGSVHIVGSAGGDALVVRGISGCDSTGIRGENVDTTDQGLFLNINGGPVLFGYADATAGNYVHVQYNQDASSTATGAFRVSGGVGISKKLYVGTNINAPQFVATHTAGGNSEFKIQYSTTISYWWGVDTQNVNHGMYDDKAGKWIISAAADNKWTFDGSVTGHASLDLPLTGGTLTGAVNFANNTWNKVGDDVQIGDINKAGHLGIQGVNGNTGIFFTTYNQTTKTVGASLSWNGTDLIADKSVQVPDITIFHNANQNVTLQYNSTDDSLDFIFA